MILPEFLFVLGVKIIEPLN